MNFWCIVIFGEVCMRKLENNKDISPNITKLQEEVKTIIMRFGTMVANARKGKGMKLQELSQKSGVSIGVISDLENEKGKIPNLYTLIALAKTLDIKNDEFLRLIFGECIHKDSTQKSPSKMLTDALVAYGVPTDIAANILVGIELSYGKHTIKD